ncbi:hypothetical protein BJ508DRAFT_308474 [Ascobolus immersus RN42]|uniref:Uncharacterized protein n=1 Tax=Ascobolus immersus RN42 TaxID=1160509 RepID=A0A3N4ICE2_ASCIM|nr:hypothetical protein BJ508DRAFT_308474 [Ascobolus immersus RN42]
MFSTDPYSHPFSMQQCLDATHQRDSRQITFKHHSRHQTDCGCSPITAGQIPYEQRHPDFQPLISTSQSSFAALGEADHESGSILPTLPGEQESPAEKGYPQQAEEDWTTLYTVDIVPTSLATTFRPSEQQSAFSPPQICQAPHDQRQTLTQEALSGFDYHTNAQKPTAEHSTHHHNRAKLATGAFSRAPNPRLYSPIPHRSQTEPPELSLPPKRLQPQSLPYLQNHDSLRQGSCTLRYKSELTMFGQTELSSKPLILTCARVSSQCPKDVTEPTPPNPVPSVQPKDQASDKIDAHSNVKASTAFTAVEAVAVAALPAHSPSPSQMPTSTASRKLKHKREESETLNENADQKPQEDKQVSKRQQQQDPSSNTLQISRYQPPIYSHLQERILAYRQTPTLPVQHTQLQQEYWNGTVPDRDSEESETRTRMNRAVANDMSGISGEGEWRLRYEIRQLLNGME